MDSLQFHRIRHHVLTEPASNTWLNSLFFFFLLGFEIIAFIVNLFLGTNTSPQMVRLLQLGCFFKSFSRNIIQINCQSRLKSFYLSIWGELRLRFSATITSAQFYAQDFGQRVVWFSKTWDSSTLGWPPQANNFKDTPFWQVELSEIWKKNQIIPNGTACWDIIKKSYLPNRSSFHSLTHWYLWPIYNPIVSPAMG